jgi:aryl-alcohol dehydrogenase-like predicted oxidoreductase
VSDDDSDRHGATDNLASRRRFMKALAIVGVGGRTLLSTRDARAAVYAAKEASGSPASWPNMPRRKLGRTGFQASRLVFGCGAALSRRRNDALLQAAFDAGINVFDVGTRQYYNDAEKNLAPFLSKVRDQVFLISKGIVRFDPTDRVTASRAREGARDWSQQLDDSLRELRQERVDAYYLMASNNPTFIRSDEVHAAFEKAKEAGKLSHLGLSTHQNAQNVLEAAVEAGWYDVAMIAITPGGWYDWEEKAILEGSPPMKQLAPLLARARASGIGLIGMKAGRYLAGRKFLGWGKSDAFDEFYAPEFLAAKLSAFQKSYAFVLAHGLDSVNADMQSFAHLGENVVAAATSSDYFIA